MFYFRSTSFYDQTVIDAGADSRANAVIDPNGIVTQTSYDAASRKTQVVEDYGSGGTYLNRTTKWTYTLDNLIDTLKAVNGTTGDQTTTYTYGTTLTDSDVARSDLLSSITYPDGGSDVVAYTYNRLGQQTQITDQRGTIRGLLYDRRRKGDKYI